MIPAPPLGADATPVAAAETAAASAGTATPLVSELSAKLNLHLGHLIAWLAITIPQSGHFFIR